MRKLSLTTISLLLAAIVQAETLHDWISAQETRVTSELTRRLSVATAWETNSVTSTNIVEKPAQLIQAELIHESLLNRIGGSCTNTYEVNATLASQYAIASLQATNAVGMALVPLISDSYTQLKAMGSKFDPWIAVYTNIATTVTVTPTRYRWQDYGLDHAPNGSEIEEASR